MEWSPTPVKIHGDPSAGQKEAQEREFTRLGSSNHLPVEKHFKYKFYTRSFKGQNAQKREHSRVT